MLRKFISIFVLAAFMATSVNAPSYAQVVASGGALNLPVPGTMVGLSPAYVPVLMKGLRVHPDNPLLFDFILDTGNSGLDVDSPAFKSESQRLIKYFLASLAIKEDDLWVNLSPYEKDRMIPKELGQTEMGRDMLAEDYILKQLTASLIYPEKKLGKEFWDRVYAQAREKFGTTNIPVNTFNKVWIVAEKAKVVETGDTAFVVGGHLKVMLEEDYLSLNKHSAIQNPTGTHSIGSQIIRQIILPEIEKEVNEGKNFSSLRQMFYSMILASWYKMAVKSALLNQVYANQKKVGGLAANKMNINAIYTRYLQAYKKGVFNYIKEEQDPLTAQAIPRKYFSGGVVLNTKPTIEHIVAANSIQPVGNFAMVATAVGALKKVKAKYQSFSSQGKRFSILLASLVTLSYPAWWAHYHAYVIDWNYDKITHAQLDKRLEGYMDIDNNENNVSMAEKKYTVGKAYDFMKTAEFNNSSTRDKKQFLSEYWPLKTEVLRGDFERLKNSEYSPSLDEKYKAIADQTREVLEKGLDVNTYDAYTLLRAVVAWHAKVSQSPQLFFESVDPSDNNTHVRWYLENKNGGTSLRIDVSTVEGLTSTIAVVDNIKTDIPRYSGREILEDYTEVVNKIIDAYPNMTLGEQKGAVSSLGDLLVRIKGRELTNPVYATIEKFLINAELKDLQDQFNILQRLSNTNNPNGVDLNSAYDAIDKRVYAIYLHSSDVVRAKAYNFRINLDLQWSHVLGKSVRFSYEVVKNEGDVIYVSGWIKDTRSRDDRGENMTPRGWLKYFVSIGEQANVLPPADSMIAETLIRTNDDEAFDIDQAVEPLMGMYDSLTDPQMQKLARIFLYLIDGRIKGHGPENLKQESGIINKFLESKQIQQSDSTNDKAQTPGGIDFNAQNMDLGVFKKGGGIQMRFDPALLARFRQSDFDGVVANILSIKPLDLKSFQNNLI